MWLRFLFILTTFSLFVASWILSGLFAGPNCINSTLFERISILKEDGSITHLSRCNLREKVIGQRYDRQSLEHKTLSNLQSLNRYKEISPILRGPVTVLIRDWEGGPVPHVSKGRVELHANHLVQKSLMERAILSSLVDHSSPMTRDVVAGFLYRVQNRSNQYFKPNLWISGLRDLNDYCFSSEPLFYHGEFCLLKKEMGESLVSDKEPAGFVGWGLKGLFADLMYEAFQGLDLREKKRLLSHLIFLGDFDDSGLIVSASKGLEQWERDFYEDFKSWMSPVFLQDLEQLDLAFEKRSLEMSEYEYFVVDSSLNLDFEPISQPSNRVSVIEWRGRKHISSSIFSFYMARAEIFKLSRPSSIAFVGCELPHPKELLEFKPHTSQASFIKICNESDFLEMLNTGVKRYLSSNKRSIFVDFHLGSLELATRLNGPIEGHSKIESWAKWLGWDGLSGRTESASGVIRPASNIEAIRGFRWGAAPFESL